MPQVLGQCTIKKETNIKLVGFHNLVKYLEFVTFMVIISPLNRVVTNTLESLSNLMQAKKLVFALILCLSLNTLLSAQDRYFRVEAKNGASAEGLMYQYELASDNCNLKRFFQINNLKPDAGLQKGKKYYLPILIFDYNGKSIRSSLQIEGWKQALRIKKYNERMHAKKLRTKSLVSSNIIWVPFNELGCDRSAPLTDPIITEAKPPKSNNTSKASVEEKVEEKKEEVVTKIEPDQKKPIGKNPEALLAGQNKSSGYRKFPIFGKKYEHIPLIDSKLKGKIYYIVSGHGGPDPGALGTSNDKRLCEDEYAYDVGLRLCRNLLEHGATVYMIIRDPDDGMRDDLYLDCDRDEYCWGNKVIPLNQKKRLKQRADAVNDLYQANLAKGIKDQTLVTIHIDSRSKGQRTDVFFYHYPKSQSSKRLALDVHKTFKDKYAKFRPDGSYHGSVSGRDLYMLRYTDPRAIFIELGNIRNARDQKRFLYETNRDALAKWLYEGLTKR